MTLKEQLAINNDKKKLVKHFNPRYVKIYETPVKPGCIYCLRLVTKDVPTYVLTESNTSTAQYDTTLAVQMDVLPNYPKTKIRVYYGNKKWLCHVNVFPSKDHVQCTDRHDPENSSLVEVAEKTLRAIVFDPTVRRYDSMASSIPEKWQREMERANKFPTMNPALLFMRNIKRTPTSV